MKSRSVLPASGGVIAPGAVVPLSTKAPGDPAEPAPASAQPDTATGATRDAKSHDDATDNSTQGAVNRNDLFTVAAIRCVWLRGHAQDDETHHSNCVDSTMAACCRCIVWLRTRSDREYKELREVYLPKPKPTPKLTPWRWWCHDCYTKYEPIPHGTEREQARCGGCGKWKLCFKCVVAETAPAEPDRIPVPSGSRPVAPAARPDGEPWPSPSPLKASPLALPPTDPGISLFLEALPVGSRWWTCARSLCRGLFFFSARMTVEPSTPAKDDRRPFCPNCGQHTDVMEVR